MREQFGEALERFVLNPGLRPEESIASELGVSCRRAGLQARLTLFFNRTDGTVDQVVISQVDGPPKRMRVNLEGSYAAGVEAEAGWVGREILSARLLASWMRARTLTDQEGQSRPLAEKPDSQGTLPPGVNARASPSECHAGLQGTCMGHVCRWLDDQARSISHRLSRCRLRDRAGSRGET